MPLTAIDVEGMEIEELESLKIRGILKEEELCGNINVMFHVCRRTGVGTWDG
jgi:hypothetical protein